MNNSLANHVPSPAIKIPEMHSFFIRNYSIMAYGSYSFTFVMRTFARFRITWPLPFNVVEHVEVV